MRPQFTVVAKACGAEEAPENTCEACEAVALLTAPPGLALALEVDVRLTADAELVALHDATLERTTNGRGLVRRRSLAELRALVAGPRGERVPQLDDVLAASGGLELVLDVHDADAASALIAWLLRRSADERARLIVASEAGRLVDAVRRARLGVRSAATPGEVLRRVLLERVGLAAFTTAGHTWMVPEQHRGLRVVSPRFARRARRDDDDLWVYVVNDAREAERLKRLGASGVFTTRPRALLGALATP